MNALQTPRFAMPLLALGQAQKEFYHNEALLLLDWLAYRAVEAVVADPSALSPAAGQAWIVGENALGEWEGRDRSIAIWTDGGWRWVVPRENMECFLFSSAQWLVFQNETWQTSTAVAAPAGGAVIDVEARDAIGSILDILRQFGLVPEVA